MTTGYAESPASKVMDEAVELAIAEESPYPEQCAFINAGTPHTDSQMESAARRGSCIVLVSPAGGVEVIPPEEIVSPSEIDAPAAARSIPRPRR